MVERKSSVTRTHLGVAFAASAEASAARRLAMGVPVAVPDWAADQPSDPGITLLELFAYLGDVLSYHQDQVANEGYLDAHRGNGGRSLRIELGASLRPAVCLVVDDHSAYALIIGSETDDATVRFGEGADGQQLPAADRRLEARYRGGPKGTGQIDLRGIHIEASFAILAVGNPKVTGRCITLWRSGEPRVAPRPHTPAGT